MTLLVCCLGALGCRQPLPTPDLPPAIVGAWFVKIPEAPFPLHLFVFHADHTVQQANPDTGDPNTSDSNAMGAWVQEGDLVKGRIVETTADRTTHRFVARGDISFSLHVAGNLLKGTATASFYDIDGHVVRGPVQATLEGQRISP